MMAGLEMALVIGITGGVGAGKSTVTEMFRDLGARTLSADEMARDVLAPGSPGLAEVAREFGGGVIGPGGVLDRQALGEIVFGDAAALDKINAITHPRIIRLIEERISEFRATANEADVLAAEIPLLVECNLTGLVDKVVVVTAEQDVQVIRLTTRGLSVNDARQRIAAQLPISSKLPFADWVVDTNTTLSATRSQVETIWHTILAAGRGGAIT